MEGNNLLSRSLTGVKKPVHDYHLVMDTLLPAAKPVVCMKNKRFQFSRQGTPVCYLLYEGYGSIFRHSDGLLYSLIKAPYILGITNLVEPFVKCFYWRAESNCTLFMVDASVAREIIAANNLWESHCRILSFLFYQLSEHSHRLVAQNGHQQVTYQIMRFMEESPEIKNSVSLPKYIIDRTLLSRSYVMKVIAELKDAGLIEVENKSLRVLGNLSNKE
jgi:hypothetical protein